MPRFAAVGFVLQALILPLSASEPALDRYDLGQRLVMLERAWDAHADAAARRRALPVLKVAVPQLLAGQNAAAAATLDRSRLLLGGQDESTPADRWAASLLIRPATRLLDPAAGPLTIRLVSGYDAGDPPACAVVRLSLGAADGSAKFASAEVVVTKLPVQATLVSNKLPQGDHILTSEVVVGGKVLATYVTGVSAAQRVNARVLQLLGPVPNERATDSYTYQALVAQLDALLERYPPPETNYPAARLLAEAEALGAAVAAKERFYGPQRTGQFWLTLPTGTTKTPVRLFVPEAAKAGKRVPLVVALHGAGGSENLFFDAYGFGLIARLAKERGWMIVAPRAGWLFDGPPPVSAIVDELAALYPVDQKQVYVVGHSMGAAHAIEVVQQSPGRYAAVAPLGGGGSVRLPAAFKALPVFIGCGSEDFLIGGAKALAKALEQAGATKVTYREFPAVEHIVIVQEALPEVFKFFAESVRDTSQKR